MKRHTKQIVAILLMLTLVLGLLPAMVFAAGGTTVYLKPNSNWTKDGARFAVYYWNSGSNGWVSMTAIDDGYYEATVPTGYSNIIFCRMNGSSSANNWNNKWNQTADLTLPANGNNCFTVPSGSWDGASTGWSKYTPSVLEDITCQVTLHFADTFNWGSVYAYGWDTSDNTPLGNWPGTVLGTDNSGFYTVTYTAQIPGGESLNFIFNNGGNGAQTVDLSIPYSQLTSGSVERYIQPTAEQEDDDTSNAKYYCDIVTSADAVVQSPVVSGTSVTFEYKNPSAKTVTVNGSFNNWNGATMTKNAYGIWTATVNNLNPGIYQYKFVVDGNWTADPVNPWVMSADNNSAFIILDPNAPDNNEITVKIHYSRPDSNYSGWNVWMWGLTFSSGQYNLQNENGHMTATVKVPGRSTQSVYYILRHSTAENAWESQEFGERLVDLSDIVSGTVHCYVNAGEFGAIRVLDTDVVRKNKIASLQFDYEAGNKITVTTTRLLDDPAAALSITNANITHISAVGSSYTLTLDKQVALSDLYTHRVLFDGYEYPVDYTAAYATDRFAAEYTYSGNDLGANWTKNSTTFRVWAPTAKAVSVKLYTTGSDGETGAKALSAHPMTPDINGTWVVTVNGDLHGTYYTYLVNVDGQTVEACDPYARTTGVNGQRAMVLNPDTTNPTAWAADTNPNPVKSYTDAIIYELHVRDFSIDDSSGVKDAWQGKFLGLTQHGTTASDGKTVTGLDYLQNLGITHLHLLPIYDYGSVDETKCDSFNWGYDPQNYNTPEGSYSTDPYNGQVRVAEMKQMVSALHESGISVVMDVVYNHVYDAEAFCFNQIVPGFFSRKYADGSYSNSSGCGNDTASEREMVRKYIIDSVLYWTREYHIDGFRFDLIGLLDVDTVNQLVDEVHAIRPDVIFYGEGWTLGGAVEPGTQMSTQANAKLTPHMAYFNDRIRDAMGGYNGSGTGFISGNSDRGQQLAENFRAVTDYTTDPTQLVQYISCHDNHTLMAKILLSTGKKNIDDAAVKMNNLAAAIYMTSQGMPFIHAGEEMLRLKVKADGSFDENSYKSADAVNAIQWNNLQKTQYAATSDYYAGLIAFRKAHPALRYATAEQIAANVKTLDGSGLTLAFQINGAAAGDLAETIIVIFNGSAADYTVNLTGKWDVCIDGKNAGTETLYTAQGAVVVPGATAMVLVQNQTAPAASVNGVPYATVQSAIDAAGNRPVKLLAASSESVTAKRDLTLDLNGFDLRKITVANGCVLTLRDTATDDYQGTYGEVTVAGQVAGDTHYLAVNQSGKYSAHRYDLALTHITLMPAKDALGYKAALQGDDVVKAQVKEMGFTLSTEAASVTRSKAGASSLSLRLHSILACQGGEVPVTGFAFVTFQNGQTVSTASCTTSMQQVMETIDHRWTSFHSAQQAAVKALVAQYPDQTATWNIPNLR